MTIEAQRENGHPKFPRSREEFFFDLISTPFYEQAFDAADAISDFLAGLVDRRIFVAHPFSRGEGLPSAAKSVEIFEGFAAGPWHYREPARALGALGHTVEVFRPRMYLNIEPLDSLAEEAINSVEKQALKYGKKVSVIGHSKGGLILAAAYAKHPDRFEESVEQVIFVGSPIPHWINKSVAGAYLMTQILLNGDDLALAERTDEIHALVGRERIKVHSIGTNDPIIKGEHIGFASEHHEVRSSHTALCHNAQSIGVIADLLAA